MITPMTAGIPPGGTEHRCGRCGRCGARIPVQWALAFGAWLCDDCRQVVTEQLLDGTTDAWSRAAKDAPEAVMTGGKQG